jgi:hypothetical protein
MSNTWERRYGVRFSHFSHHPAPGIVSDGSVRPLPHHSALIMTNVIVARRSQVSASCNERKHCLFFYLGNWRASLVLMCKGNRHLSLVSHLVSVQLVQSS